MYKYFKILTLLLFILYILNVIQCQKRICRNVKKKQENEENATCNLYDPGEIDNHLPPQFCRYTTLSKGKRINPYKHYKNLSEEDVFKSACVKCAACLAVAHNINQTFFEYYASPDNENRILSEKCLCDILEPLCSKGFKNYDLRRIDGNAVITTISPQSKHVFTNLDGLWTKKLREMCFYYIKNINCDIQYGLRKGTINFVDYLCKSDGVFRECRNIDLKHAEISDTESDIILKLCVSCN